MSPSCAWLVSARRRVRTAHGNGGGSVGALGDLTLVPSLLALSMMGSVIPRLRISKKAFVGLDPRLGTFLRIRGGAPVLHLRDDDDGRAVGLIARKATSANPPERANIGGRGRISNPSRRIATLFWDETSRHTLGQQAASVNIQAMMRGFREYRERCRYLGVLEASRRIRMDVCYACLWGHYLRPEV